MAGLHSRFWWPSGRCHEVWGFRLRLDNVSSCFTSGIGAQESASAVESDLGMSVLPDSATVWLNLEVRKSENFCPVAANIRWLNWGFHLLGSELLWCVDIARLSPRLGIRREDVRKLFSVFISGNHFSERYVFARGLERPLWMQIFDIWCKAAGF